ncbi:Rod binding protein [Cribrihabitans marinus]|uniref:Rod binding protein n=1 Tax=Cribrihabitans marinus TaxID=1227549 RepID=A0A1H6Y3I9_9RHOB|nr:rod-binding protein [Cribrihabitans marinus]GGH27928.1 chemotaxis protein CheL [Cribrihabitans marinus]SEJ31690.1 Rod binding protein [Cribrihabitans marinus]
MKTAPTLPVATGHRIAQDPTARLREAATGLEARFLAEMLKSAGMDQARSAFGGGAGEDQFASFLVQEQADRIARSGGIGLAEMIFNSLKEKVDANRNS